MTPERAIEIFEDPDGAVERRQLLQANRIAITAIRAMELYFDETEGAGDRWLAAVTAYRELLKEAS